MTPARTWILLVAIAAAVTLGVLALAAVLERRPPGRGAFREAPIPRIDVHRHVGPVYHGNAERPLGFRLGDAS